MIQYKMMQSLRKWWQERNNMRYRRAVDPVIRRSTLFYTRGIPAIFLILCAYQWVRTTHTQLITRYTRTDQNMMMFRLNHILNRNTFQPTFYLPFGLFQWLYSTLIEDEPFIRYQKQGNILQVPLHNNSKDVTDLPLFVVIAGAMGLNHSTIHLLNRANADRYRVVCVLPQDYYDCKKLNAEIGKVRDKYPAVKMYGVGFDYGANLMVNYAVQYPKMFDAMLSIANPLDLGQAEREFKGKSKYWRKLKEKIIEGRLGRVEAGQLEDVDRVLYKLKEEGTKEMKERNSSLNKIWRLQTRTLFLQSLEDPLSVYNKDDPRLENDNCIYVWTQRGGHTEWYYGLWADIWFLPLVMQYFQNVGIDKAKFRAMN